MVYIYLVEITAWVDEFCSNSRKKFSKRFKKELTVLADILPDEHKTTIKDISKTMRFRTTPSEKRLCSLETNKPVVGSGENLQEPSLDGQTHQPRDESNVGLALSNEGSELNFKVY